ncbi:MAG: carboxylesterase family protein, partial [Lentisphaeria bacterium]|nr:carboxylesterase family protein [Lentisphaeria bacterium]
MTLYILLALLMLAVLELNRNRLIGSIIIVLCAAGVIALRLTVLSARPWYLKLSAVIGFIGLFAAVLFLTWPPTRAVPASVQKNPEYTGVYTVAQGKMRGVTVSEGKVELFAGIPYAKPPVGDLRWREPQDPDAWDGVLDADTFAPMSMQPVNLPIYDSLAQIIGYHDYKVSLSDNHVPPVSEDSLYLNVWRPAGEVSGAPVLVFIHGGSLQTGQPWYGDYSGEGLAREGVIVVNMGYRLGIFGFMAADELIAESSNGTTGNYGLLDQIKALEWVRDNIAAFGGDPDNITLAGESAGAVCVSALCTSPLARGLFRRVILESSTLASVTPPHSFRTREDALAAGSRTLAKYG